MSCTIPSYDVTGAAETLQSEVTDMAADYVTQNSPTAAEAFAVVSDAQAVVAAAEQSIAILAWIDEVKAISNETDLTKQLQNLEMSGTLGRGLSAFGLGTVSGSALPGMMENVSQGVQCNQDDPETPGPDQRPGDMSNGSGSTGSWAGGPPTGGGGGSPPMPGPAFGRPPGGDAPWGDDGQFDAPKLDPLVLDLDGNGVSLTALATSNAYFDLDNDGFAEKTGWVSATDGFLVRDLSGNGRIDSITEMFGAPGQNAFDALSALDLNHDGKISSADSGFASLRVWIDADGDGYTDTGELRTLVSLNITEVSVIDTASGANVHGSIVDSTSTFTMGGVTRASAAILFDLDQTQSKYIPPANFTYNEEALFLPEFAGYGDVADLRVAMTLDADLRGIVKDLVLASGEMTYAQLRAGIEDVILAWTGADGVAAGSRGAHIDARHLAAIEALYGTAFVQPLASGGNGSEPNSTSGPALERIFDNMVDFFGAMFVSQAGYADALNSPDMKAGLLNPLWVFASDTYDGTLASAAPTLQEVVRNIYDEVLGSGRSEWISTMEQLVPWLGVTRKYMFEGNDAAFETALYNVMDQYFGDAAIKTAWMEIARGTNVVDLDQGEAASAVTSGDDLINISSSGGSAIGGWGDDTYFYTYLDGAVTISDYGPYSPSDRLILSMTFLSETSFSRSTGHDLLITLAGGDVITISNQFESNGWDRIETFLFADGSVLSEADIRALLIAQSTTSGNDIIRGFHSNDTLSGGLGDDTLIGYGGNDIYAYGLGDGHDLIRDGGIFSADTLSMLGVSLSAVALSRGVSDKDDLILTFGDGGTVTVDEQFYSTGWDKLESFAFADQTLTHVQLMALMLDRAMTPGADVIDGFDVNDIISGAGGDDTLHGVGGNDKLIGGDGDDDLRGGAGIDRLVGQAGADRMEGGTGGDTFEYNAVAESTYALSDRIIDLSAGDFIDLSNIDANTGISGDQAFSKVAAFSNTAGELTVTYVSSGNHTDVCADVDGDGVADFRIVLTGDHAAFTGFVW